MPLLYAFIWFPLTFLVCNSRSRQRYMSWHFSSDGLVWCPGIIIRIGIDGDRIEKLGVEQELAYQWPGNDSQNEKDKK